MQVRGQLQAPGTLLSAPAEYKGGWALEPVLDILKERKKKTPAPAGNSDRKTMGEGGLRFSTKMLYVFDLSHPCYMSGPLHLPFTLKMGTAVAQWLRCCVTNRKVAGSIPAGVTEIFH